MEEFAFRGKQLDGKWVYGYYFACVEHGDNGLPEYLYKETHTILHYIIDIDGKQYLVNPNTIGQAIGLFDKNGNKIYEGDIVKVSCSYGYGFLAKGSLATIIWNENELCYKLKGQGEYRMTFNKKVEVIGNIIDTPELS